MDKRIRSRGGLPPNKYLTKEQVRKLKKYCQTQACQAKERGNRRAVINSMIIDLLLNSGLRAAELCELQMRDLPHVHGKFIIDVRRGKGSLRRPIKISPALAKRIKSFVKKYRRGAKPGSYLFVNENFGRLSYESLYSKLHIIGIRAGISQLSPHMCRHSYAMSWFRKYKDLSSLKQQMGHKSILVTNIYAETVSEELLEQSELFDLWND